MNWLADDWAADKPQKQPGPVMVHSVNLWSAMTRLESEGRKDNCIYPRITGEILQALGWQARFYNQELSVQAIEDGWIIGVFSCDTDCIGDGVEIFIPKDTMTPCEIRKDRCGQLEWHHS